MTVTGICHILIIMIPGTLTLGTMILGITILGIMIHGTTMAHTTIVITMVLHRITIMHMLRLPAMAGIGLIHMFLIAELMMVDGTVTLAVVLRLAQHLWDQAATAV